MYCGIPAIVHDVPTHFDADTVNQANCPLALIKRVLLLRWNADVRSVVVCLCCPSVAVFLCVAVVFASLAVY
jgi:hypothetical protein